MPDHIVKSYDTDLENLRRSISEMGGIAEKMMTEAGEALVRRDSPLAQTVIAADTRLDTLQREIEERAILLIARRQPLAIDLRETVTAIRVSNDIERIEMQYPFLYFYCNNLFYTTTNCKVTKNFYLFKQKRATKCDPFSINSTLIIMNFVL